MRLVRHFKHWFVPHKHNDHRPHLIRWHGLAVVVAVIVAVQGTAYALRPAAIKLAAGGQVLAYASDITPTDLLVQTNQQRTAAGLAPLKMDARLNQSAALKAANMFQEDYWAHVSPSGIQPWHWFDVAGYHYQYAGENLAKDFDTTSGTIAGWMNSPGHRANILNGNYADVGFAVVNGTLVGGQTTLVVAHYGTVAGVSVAATVPAPAKPAASVVPKPAVAPVSTPTPAPATPQPTPVPTPPPAATPVSAKPVASGTITEATPSPKSYSLFAPLAINRTLNGATLTTIILLGVLLMVYLFTHMTVWRKGLKRWRHHHYRGLAAVQVGGLSLIILYLITSGFGQVG